MSSRIVIVAYKPKPGKEDALHRLMFKHHLVLKNEDLVTDREPFLMQAKDGTVVEVFEWKSDAAIHEAHTKNAVIEMWAEYADACDYIPLCKLAETNDLFASFSPLNNKV